MTELDYQYLASLVEKIKSGDSNAFAELYTATYQKQFHFAYRYLKDEYLAQDAIQEVYILVLKNISKLHNPKLFLSWINQITFRICFDMAQKRSRDVQELNTTNFLDISQESEGTNNPELTIANKDEKDYILEKIMELPAYESQAIIMRYYNNMSLDEIAAAMDCSRSTIKRHLTKGRKELEQYLNKEVF